MNNQLAFTLAQFTFGLVGKPGYQNAERRCKQNRETRTGLGNQNEAGAKRSRDCSDRIHCIASAYQLDRSVAGGGVGPNQHQRHHHPHQ
jgi:hypothetical protein